MGVNSLPKTVLSGLILTASRLQFEQNLPSAPESSSLTIRLQSHPLVAISYVKSVAISQ